MINLRLAKKKAKKLAQPTTMEEGPRYPWGTSVTLETETLKKLGQGVGDYSIGDSVALQGIAKVTSLRKSENERGPASQTVDLQLTNLGVNKGKTLREVHKAGNPCPKSKR